MDKKTIILIVLYFFEFYPTSLWGKEYFAKLNQKAGAGVGFFGPLKPEPEPLEKQYQEPESPEPLGKNIRSRSR